LKFRKGAHYILVKGDPSPRWGKEAVASQSCRTSPQNLTDKGGSSWRSPAALLPLQPQPAHRSPGPDAARPQVDPAYGALHRAGTYSLQELVSRLKAKIVSTSFEEFLEPKSRPRPVGNEESRSSGRQGNKKRTPLYLSYKKWGPLFRSPIKIGAPVLPPQKIPQFCTDGASSLFALSGTFCAPLIVPCA
jgi:hypothetical protein